MRLLKNLLRRWLASRGLVLNRVEPEVPPSLSTCLRNLRSRLAPPASLICFDNDVWIQSEILTVFPEDQVQFSSPLFTTTGTLAPGSSLPAAPTGRFVGMVDIDSFSLPVLSAKIPWLHQADALLLHARLGSFWAGELDLCSLKARIKALGFHLTDVVSNTGTQVPQAPAGSVFLICERESGVGITGHGPNYRLTEALTYLSTPIVQRRDFQMLAGRGSFGFTAGMYNPGAIVAGGQTWLLARAEQTPWTLQKTQESLYFTAAQPWLLGLGADNSLSSADGLAITGLPQPARAEDFRLFEFCGQIFSNHSVTTKPAAGPPSHRPLRLERMTTRIGLSRLDLTEKQFIWRGHPNVNRPLAQMEKNWAMFTDGARLFLLYSFSPYVLLAAQNWPGLDFKTLIETRLDLPLDGDGLTLRNSINPVDYDEAHWLHIIHKVHPVKQYSFWAVLISKRTLRPVRLSARPFICGWHSYPASIIYACSVIAGPANIEVFAGLDDAATAVATIPRERLDAEWVPVTTPEDQPA